MMLRNFNNIGCIKAFGSHHVRSFSQYRPLRSGGHDHAEELNEEEKFSNNPAYISALAISGLFITYTVLNDSYKKSHQGESLTSQIAGPVTPGEQIIEVSDDLNRKMRESADLRQMMSTPVPRREIRQSYAVETIPRGSQFNHYPGSLIDVDNVGPRRKPKSIFDD